MRLPGVPAVVIVPPSAAVPARRGAGSTASRRRSCGTRRRTTEPATPREADLHAAAAERALETVSLPLSAPLWTRMESLGIESGRLGSERLQP